MRVSINLVDLNGGEKGCPYRKTNSTSCEMRTPPTYSTSHQDHVQLIRDGCLLVRVSRPEFHSSGFHKRTLTSKIQEFLARFTPASYEARERLTSTEK